MDLEGALGRPRRRASQLAHSGRRTEGGSERRAWSCRRTVHGTGESRAGASAQQQEIPARLTSRRARWPTSSHPQRSAGSALAGRPTMRPCRVRSASTWSGMTRCHVEAVRHKTL